MIGSYSPFSELQNVVLVGNNRHGSVDIFDPKSYEVVKHLNIVPDHEERMEEIYSGVIRRIKSTFIRGVIGKSNG